MTASWIIQTIIVAGIGLIGYFLKDLKKGFEVRIGSLDCKLDTFEEKVKKDNKDLEARLDTRIKCTEERCEDLQRDLNAYRDHVNRNFTLKDDFIRAISGIDRKLDKIIDTMMERRAGA
jgi:archaellum component FlaC